MPETGSLLAAYERFCVLLLLAGAALWLLQSRYSILTKFISETSSALNLAVFRIGIVAGLWNEIDFSRILPFASLNQALLFPPRGWSIVAPRIPRSPLLVETAYGVFLVCGILMAIGLLGRWATLGTALSSFYLLTLPQLFGKVNHYHHLIFFCCLLVFLPCFDTLSLDALLRSVRSAHKGVLIRNNPSRTYAFGPKIAFLTIGLIYFFPGAWKVSRSWPYWFTGKNMASIIALRLLELTSTKLQVEVLHMPLLLSLAAFGAVGFELSMFFLILIKPARPLAALSGLLFHNVTGILMGIRFMFLQICYVAFIDWTRLAQWAGNKLRLAPATVFYDGRNRWSRRVVAILVNLDWLNLLNFVLSEGPSFAAATEDSEAYTGLAAYSLAASRIALFWPLYPCLQLASNRPKRGEIVTVGNAVSPTALSGVTETGSTSSIARPACWLAALYLGCMICLGVAHGVNCWPVACYPTFDGPTIQSLRKLSVQTVDQSNRTMDMTLSYDGRMGELLGSEHWDGLVQQFLRGGIHNRASAPALIELWRKQNSLTAFKSATLSVDTYALNPATAQLTFLGRAPLSH